MNFQLNLKKVVGEQRKALFQVEKQQHVLKKVFLVFLIAIFLPFSAHASLVDSWGPLLLNYSYNPTYQSACVVQGNNTIFSYRENIEMVPASVSKLYVTDWALSVRGPEYRYKTKFTLSGNTLSIIGGRDPQFIDQDLQRVLKNLSKTERSRITKISFDKNVIFNWQTNPIMVDTELERIAKRYLGRRIRATYTPLLLVESKKKARVTLTSPKLYRILKEMNQYSNNITTDSMFADLGGTKAFNAYMEKTYGEKGKKAVFLTGSGIYGNTTTCELTLLVLKNIQKNVIETNHVITDILVVPTIDDGANKTRFTENGIGPSLALKTGHVYHSYTVAGILNTTTEPVYFAIFTFDPLNPEPAGGDALVQKFVSLVGDQFSHIPFLYENQDFNTLDERIFK